MESWCRATGLAVHPARPSTCSTRSPADPATWRYGYELGLEVGLRSGSLYPILVRLTDRELLESRWETDPPPGRPPRHLYRLTPPGTGVRRRARAHVAPAARAGGPSFGARHRRRSSSSRCSCSWFTLCVPRHLGATVHDGPRSARAAARARRSGCCSERTHEDWGLAMLGRTRTGARTRAHAGASASAAWGRRRGPGPGPRPRFVLGGGARDRAVVLAADRRDARARCLWRGAPPLAPLGALGVPAPASSRCLTAYAAVALALSRGDVADPPLAARRRGVVAGVVVGAASYCVLAPTDSP